jgi:hypothetical protein
MRPSHGPACATPTYIGVWLGGFGSSYFDGAAFDGQGLAVDQGVSHLLVCGLDDASERLAGDVHPLCRLVLVEPFQVGQAQGLQFIDR